MTSVQPVSPHPPSHETHADVAKAHSEPWPEAPAASAQPLQGTVRCLVPGDSAEEEEEAESDEEQSGEIQWGVASNREEAVRNRQHAIGTVANRGAGDPRPVETLSPSSQTEEKTPRSSARSLPRSGAVVANAGRSALVINSGMRTREDADGASTVTEPPESTETAGQTTLTTAGVWKYLGNTNAPKQIKVSHNYSGSSESGSLTSGSRSPNRTPASPVDTRGSRQPLAKQVKPAIRSFGTSSSTAGQSVVFLNASIRGDILHRTASESGKFRDHVAIRDSIGDLEVVNSRPPTGTSSTSHISNSATDESDF